MLTFRKGLKDGIPIALGYLSVSFTFGMMCAKGQLPLWITQLISMTNLTSAGQFAGTDLILAQGLLMEVFVTTLVINLRYMLMSFSLSQKFHPAIPRYKRAILAFFNTDEVFAVAMQQRGFVNTRYMLGLGTLPYVGWATGTLLGAVATGLLPDSVSGALGVAIYGMFIAIVIPPAKKDKAVLLTAGLAVALSCTLRFLTNLSSGWVIILCAVAAASAAALLFPVKEARA